MNPRWTAALALVTLLCLASSSLAQTPAIASTDGGGEPGLPSTSTMMQIPVEPPGPIEAATDNKLHLLIANEFVSKYYYRGWLQENQGIIAQPLLRIDLDLWKGQNDVLTNVGIVTGFRNSLHSERTIAHDRDHDIWYEADIVAGIRWEFFKRLSIETKYVAISSPADAWETIQEFDADFAFDDKGLWFADFEIKPTLLIAHEFHNSAGGDPEGTLLEIGIEPGMTIIPSMSFPLHLSFPIKAAFSLDDYYVFLPFGTAKDSTFGYFKVGFTLFLPLTFIPPQYGKWAVSVGGDFIELGDNMEMFASRKSDYIGRVGFGVKF